jgi:hypothetical protein
MRGADVKQKEVAPKLGPTDRRALLLLGVGALIGVLAGALTAVHQRTAAPHVLPPNVMALVNGKPISEEDYERALALLAGDQRTEVTDEDRAHVLQRLIDEMLLVQHGVEIGLVDSDRAVRKALTQAMLASIAAESVSEQPSEDTLHAFYQDNAALFEHTASFVDIHEQVEAAYVRQAQDQALREYLAWLRSEAKIVRAPEFLQ